MDDISLTEAAIYATDRLALALLIGTSAVWLITNNEQRAIAASSLRRMFDIALTVLLITTTAILLLRTASLAEVGVTETLPFVSRVISGSAFGTLWLGRVIVLLLLITVWLYSRRALSLSSCILMAAGGIITACCISGASHAGDEGAFTLDNLTNTAHIVAGWLWGGAVIAYALMLKRAHGDGTIAIAASAERLSTLATFALITVVTTGLLNGLHRLESFDQLWNSGYGTTLLFKLSFVAAMMAIGALNRFYVVPSICRQERGASHLLLRTLHIDTAFFLVIIGSAAALGMQSPH